MRPTSREADVAIINCGSIVQFHARTQAARDWFDQNVHTEGWQWMGRTLCVEPRYAEDLALGLADAGLLGD